jgi:hypothetical protein
MQTEKNKYNEDFFARCSFFFQFQFKEIYDFSSRLSRYLSPRSKSVDLIFRNWCINFHFMTVFFFVNEFDIHKFVIYYANGHLNYLPRVKIAKRKRKEIFRFDNDDYSQDMQSKGMRFHANKLFCIVFGPRMAKVRTECLQHLECFN